MEETASQEPPRRKNPTIRDVSRLAGVSTATVSRVLAGSSVVSEMTRQRVMEAVRALNYQVNRTASNLRRSKISKIGVVITDIQNPFFSTVVRGIEKVTIAAGYTLILGNSDEDAEREGKLVQMLLEEGVAGLLFVPTHSACDLYHDLVSSRTPVVILDRKIAGCDLDCVGADGYSGATLAVEHLASLGHQRIAFIGGLPHLSVMQEREKGYRDALQQHNLPVPDSLVRYANNRQDGGYQAMVELLSLEDMPSAVLIANNLMTLGGLQAIHEAGVRIPQQLSLVGFDDMDWAASLQPALTVIAQPAYEMGQEAARLLLARIMDPAMPSRQITLGVKLVLRASCQRIQP